MTIASPTKVTEKPLILSSAEVRAILEGRKTQKRVAIKDERVRVFAPGYADDRERVLGLCPYGRIGDRLWVREALRCDGRGMFYDADGLLIDKDLVPNSLKRVAEFNDPFHMPRWACRITLELTGVRVEKLQEIDVDDVCFEGVESMGFQPEISVIDGYLHVHDQKRAIGFFRASWDAVNIRRGYSWESNPWVWVLSFRRI